MILIITPCVQKVTSDGLFIVWRRLDQGHNLRLASPPAFYALAKDMSLNRGATYFTLKLRPFIYSTFLLLIYLCSTLRITQLRPWKCSISTQLIFSRILDVKHLYDRPIPLFLRYVFCHSQVRPSSAHPSHMVCIYRPIYTYYSSELINFYIIFIHCGNPIFALPYLFLSCQKSLDTLIKILRVSHLDLFS